MSTTPTQHNTTITKAERWQFIIRYCKKRGHIIEECRGRFLKEQERYDRKHTPGRPPVKYYTHFPHHRGTNYTAERCLKSPNAANRYDNTKLKNSKNVQINR